ncbi:type II toxin-antitoxin system death-on-curing family toxin [Apilactobacillus kunkeei]|uniref:type II toxin-antitoxin system death-on-curing family toxin n=1 Tax=Apilactobacillus kunkeei TaxID=148814 RepID=UPI0030E7BAE6
MNYSDASTLLFISGNKNDILTDFQQIIKNTVLEDNPSYKNSEISTEVVIIDDDTSLIDAKIELSLNEKPIHFFDIWLSDYIKLNSLDLIKLNKDAERFMFSESYNNGLKDSDGLDAIVVGVDNSFYEMDVCPTVIDKAVYFWYKIAQKQLFHNGNKRTALLSALILLNVNGYNFKGYNYQNLDDDGVKELYNISLKIANHEMNQEELKKYVLGNLTIDFKHQDDIITHITERIKNEEDDNNE